MNWFLKQVRDPERDCTKFDPVLRARELFEALDINGDGGVSEEEFIRYEISFEELKVWISSQQVYFVLKIFLIES